jgi:biopolymer transport protein ExbB
MHASWLDLWQATGPLARAVLAILAAMSVAAVAAALGRWRTLAAAERASAAFLARWRAERPADPAALAAEYPASPIAALIGLAARARMSTVDPQARWMVVERVARRELVATGVELRRGLGVLATVGSTAPFVGLFGTVAGIIDAFHELDGQGGIAAISIGLAEALVATALGIVVAIPALWAFNHLTQRVTRLMAALECAAEEFAIAELQAAPPAPARAQVAAWR